VNSFGYIPRSVSTKKDSSHCISMYLTHHCFVIVKVLGKKKVQLMARI